MLSQQLPSLKRGSLQQRGVVLMITLIVLVAMTLAGIALVRSVDTTSIIAGNLAFQQAATHSGDSGIEAAIVWLENNNSGTTLHNDITAQGYSASWNSPAAIGVNESWADYWTNSLVANSYVATLPVDQAGNTVSYSIQRLCSGSGNPTATGAGAPNCTVVTSANAVAAAGNSEDAGSIPLQYSSQVYYRITSRIVGPRNTVSFVQAVVAM